MTKITPVLAPLFALLVALALPQAARAQLAPAQLAAQQVTALAPQLALLAGSPANLQALAAGLVLGQPIVLTATTPDGITQTVTLAANAAMTPLVAAQVLEGTRQALITRGIAAPTPEQVGATLVGGTLATPLGNTLVSGTLTGSVNPAAMQIQRQVAGLAPGAGTNANPNLQALNNGLTTGAPITLTGNDLAGAASSLTFQVPGGPMTQLEASQTLAFASQLLASQGIVNPSADQIRAALLGGEVLTPTGPRALRGVTEGRGTVQTAISTFGTSFSPSVSTSTSPVFGTSFSPTVTPGQPGATGAGPNGPPSIAAQLQGRR
jgi:hypothetical protein